MNRAEIEKLKELAERAELGGWEFERQDWERGDISYEINNDFRFIALRQSEYDKPTQAKFDADFIGAAKPTTITTLCRHLLAQERMIEVAMEVDQELRKNLGGCSFEVWKQFTAALAELDQLAKEASDAKAE